MRLDLKKISSLTPILSKALIHSGRDTFSPAIAKDTTDKNEDIVAQLKSIQEQISDLVLNSRMSHQDREERME